MSTALDQILQQMRAAAKKEHPWTRGEPASQPIYEWRAGQWHAFDIKERESSDSDLQEFSVVSWNIDCLRSHGKERMVSALKFLEEYVSSLPRKPIVMFNEMTSVTLELIQAQPWIRDAYCVTDTSTEFWESNFYGTCVLIPKLMVLTEVFRIHYHKTNMERDALFIDVKTVGNQILRVCSTHLESLVSDPPLRPAQLQTAAGCMHQADASILGGDLNAIQPFDKTLHSDNGLKDVYLEQGGEEDSEAGMTWGQMAATSLRSKFGLSRMDKYLFCGNMMIDHFETFGMDVVTHNKEAVQDLVKRGDLEKPWVTDHLGIRADFQVLLPTSASSSL